MNVTPVTLEVDLCELINSAHLDTWETFDWVRKYAPVFGLTPRRAAKWKTPGEPAFVSRLIDYPFAASRLLRVIEDHLKPKGICVRMPLVSGVFIHQKPKVAFV